MRIYISCHDREPANELADALEAAGHKVTSTWHRSNEVKPAIEDYRAWKNKAADNFERIEGSEELILITGPERYPGGKFVEAGFAMGVGVPVIVLGYPENGMMHGCEAHYATSEDLIADLDQPEDDEEENDE